MKILKLNINIFADTSVNVELEVRSNLTGINDTVSALEVLKDHVTNINNMPVNVKFNMNNILKESEQLTTNIATRLGNLNIPAPNVSILDKVSDSVLKLNNDMARAPIVIGQSVETLGQKFAGLPVNINKSTDSVDKLGNSVKKTANSVNTLGSVGKSVTGSLSKGFKTMLASLGISATIAGITKAVKSAVTAAADYEEARNLFVMAVGQYKDENFKWAQKISSALYLDDSEILQYTGSFYNLTKGLGATSDAANLMAKNLTQLTYDMSSYLNIDVSVANTKLMSAMSGQTKAVTNVGIAMQQASLQEFVYELGIKKSIASMTQAEKTYLRYIQIMRSTKQMQGDLGRTIITPTNAFRMLSTQVTLLGRAFGQMLTPVIYKFMPMLIALTRVITQAAQALAKFLGYKVQDIDYSGVEGLTDSIGDLGKEVDKTAAKANRLLAPFDQLNVVESKSGGGGGAGSSVLDQLAQQLKGYDMLDQLNEKMADSISDWEEKIKGFGKTVAIVAAGIAGLKILGWLSNLSSAMAGISGTGVGAGLVTLLKNVGTEGSIAAGAMKSFGTIISKDALVAIAPFMEVIGGVPLAIKGMFDATEAGANAAKDQTGYTMDQLGALAETVGGFALTLTGVFGFPAGTVAGVIAGLITYSATFGTAFQKGLDEISLDKINQDMGTLQISTEKWLKTLTENGGSLGDIITRLEEYEESLHKNEETVDTYVQTALGDFRLYSTGVGEYATVSKDMLKNVTTDIENITTTSGTGIKTYMDQQLTWMQDMYDSGDEIQKKFWKEQMDELTKNGKNSQNIIDTSSNEIIKIWTKANKEHRNLTDEERAQINEHMNKITSEYNSFTQGIKTNSDDLYDAMLKTQNGFSVESIRNFISTKEEYLKKVEEEANKEYDFIKAHYEREVAAGRKNQADMDAALDEANKTKENKIKKSNEVVEKYQSQIREQVANEYTKMLQDTDKWSENDRKILEGLFDGLDLNPKDYWEKIDTYAWEGTKILDEQANKWDAPGMHAGESFFSGFDNTLKNKLKKTTYTVKTKSEVSSDGKTITMKPSQVESITAKANGGFLNTGDLFIANEAGPEFITSIGNKSAVVNQDQMVNAVAAAVSQVASALTNNNGQPTTVIVNLGDEKLYEGQGSYQSRQTDRYGTTVVNI